ncbi:MAG: response regulator, partial [Bdellovibrionales bacterium]|nr:response regulator [Bdellovibrionales bacterium]
QSFIKNLWHTILSGQIWRGEIRNKAKDGTIYWVDTSIIPSRDNNGLINGFTAIRTDITQKKIWENELIEAKEIAQKALKTKATFLANMSHEIRTPLNGILGCSNLLLDTIKDPESKKLLDTILVSGDTLLTLINDILDFSKLESEKMELENEAFNLKGSVDQVNQLFMSKASEKSLTLISKFNDDVPTWIFGDVTRLRQVLSNLVSNAIKFTAKGSVKVMVQLEEKQGENYKIRFSVVDQGIGINKEGTQNLFKSFSQVDASTTKKFGGTGLGLAICKALVELMGGKIGVDSQEGKGSTFYFTVLAKKAEARAEHIEQSNQSKYDTTMAKTHPLRILLADDNRVNQLVGKKMLEKLGYRMDVVANGKEVLQLLKEQTYDLIFMDCHMPEMDGFEATKIILENFKEKRPRIVALTASAMKEDKEKCFASGMDDFVTKPIDIKDVLRVLKDCQANTNLKTDVVTFKVIDEQTLLNQFAGDEVFLEEIANEFIFKVDEYMSDIEKAINTVNAKQLEHVAHTLKGSAANFQADSVVQKAFVLEQAGRNKNFSNVNDVYKDLVEDVELFKIELARLGKKKAG